MPWARAAINSSWRRASASSGVGAASTSAGIQRSGSRYAREKPLRRMAVISPVWKRCSTTRLPSPQPHQLSVRRDERWTSRSPTTTGPRWATSASAAATSSGWSWATRRTTPQACSLAMRQRSSGWRSTGCSDASWPQYSNTSRLPHSHRLRASRSYGPRRAKNTSSWLRVTTFTESSCTVASWSSTRRKCRRSTRPRGRGWVNPWAASATRRASRRLMSMAAVTGEHATGRSTSLGLRLFGSRMEPVAGPPRPQGYEQSE